MADIQKPLTEIARNTRNTSSYLHPTKLISPEFLTIALADSPYSLLTNIPKLRSVTFILWTINGTDTVTINFPNTTKIFNDIKYEGFVFSYAIDIQRDCELVKDIIITIEGDATVDLVYTTD